MSTRLVSPQQWMRSPSATLHHQHLVLFDFKIFATLMGIKLYLIDILICVFLVTLGVEHLSLVYWLSRFSLLWIAGHILHPFLKLSFQSLLPINLLECSVNPGYKFFPGCVPSPKLWLHFCCLQKLLLII